MTHTLKDAIERSRSHNERVALEFDGDVTELCAALAVIYDGEIDDATENDGSIDVWGWTNEMAADQMDWRLCVTVREILLLDGPHEVHPSASVGTWAVVHNGRVRNDGLTKQAAIGLAEELNREPAIE